LQLDITNERKREIEKGKINLIVCGKHKIEKDKINLIGCGKHEREKGKSNRLGRFSRLGRLGIRRN
jgi:hypothetical protein